MRQEVRKTSAKEKKELFGKRRFMVIAALEAGHTTRRLICEKAMVTPYVLTTLFNEDKELYSAYKVRRKTMSDTAADNIQDIINDPNHPQHFAASKFILTKFKSDLDVVLEPYDSEDIKLEIDSGANVPKTVIKFTKK